MKYIDFIIQSLIMLGALVFGVVGAVTSPDVFAMILMIQFYLGCWQFTSSVISLITRAAHFKAKSIYITMVVIYLLSLYATLNNGFDISHFIIKLYWTIPAWSLAIYYYVITWQWVFPKTTGGGKFLPHINF